MSEKLLPCPFCGGEAEVRYQSNLYGVRCKKCLATVAAFDTEADAIEAWNKRAKRKKGKWVSKGAGMKPFIPKMKSYYAVKFTGLDASGNVHTFTTDLDGYDKKDAKKKLYSFADVYGINIVKISNFASFADPVGAIYQVEMWNKEMLRSRNENNENQHKNMGFSG